MSVLMEWYDSGSAPHEALGRAARKLARGGALYVGGGIGAEKRSTPKGDEYNVASAAGATTETFTGPLTAAMRAYALAGASTEASTPGGSTTIADPAVAARVAELSERLRSIDDDVARYQRRLARSAARKQAQPYSPVNSGGGVSVADDDAWEQRRIDELRVEQQQVEAERAMLLAGGGLSEVEQARPGTNFTKIPAANVSKLRPIIDHYKGMAHPFTACVRDQVKHGLSADHAKRRCAVVKDLGAGTTKWRKGGGKSGKIAEALLSEALERVEAVQEAVGVVAMVQLVECGASVEAGRTSRELVEMLTTDFALLAWAEHPLGLLVFPEVAEASDHWRRQPRDDYGKWRDTFVAAVKGLRPGKHVELPDGRRISAVERTYNRLRPNEKTRHLLVEGRRRNDVRVRPGQREAYEVTQHDDAESAVKRALDRSAQDTRPTSLGGATAYDHEEHARGLGAKFGEQGKSQGEVHAEQAKAFLDGLKPGESKTFGGGSLGGVKVTKLKGGKFQVGDEAISGPQTPAKALARLKASADTERSIARRQGEREGSSASPSSGATRQAAIAGRRVRVPGGTATRQEATAASRAAVPGAAEREQLRQTIGALPKGQRYQLVNGQGKQVGHVEPTDGGFKVVTPQETKTFATAGGAAAYANRFERQQRANETTRQRGRARRLGHTAEAEEPQGIGMLLEGFSSSSGAGGVGTRPDLRAQRQVKRAQQAGTLKTPTSKRAKPSKPSGSSSSASDSSKHPRGRTGTPEGGRFVSKGSSGEDVRAVQRKVGASPDGKFGPKTAAAVRQFQQAHGLQVDGVVGRQTALAMRGHIETARKTAPGAMHAVDHQALKTMRRGTKGRSGKVGPRRRGGVVV